MARAIRTRAVRLRSFHAAEARIGRTAKARERWLQRFIRTDLDALDRAARERLGWEAQAYEWHAMCRPRPRAGRCARCVDHPVGVCLSPEPPLLLRERQLLARARLAGVPDFTGLLAGIGATMT